MLNERLCTWMKLLTDLQILGCELYQNALPTYRPTSRYKGEWMEGRGKKELGIGMRGDGREGRGEVGRDGKRKESSLKGREHWRSDHTPSVAVGRIWR